MPKQEQVFADTIRILQEAGLENPKSEARYLLCAHLTCDPSALYVWDKNAPFPEYSLYQQRLEQRCAHKPLSRIMGYRDFFQSRFMINDHVLDPRTDSEALLEIALDVFPNRQDTLSILDMGCGSGCLIISLLKEYPNAHGIGLDISKKALIVSQHNADNLELKPRFHGVQGSWDTVFSERFDLVITNPPYIPQQANLPRAVSNFDPELALFAGDDGLDCYRKIIPRIPYLLKPEGIALGESHPKQCAKIADLALCHDLSVFSPLSKLRPFCHPEQLGLSLFCPIHTSRMGK